MPTAPPNDQAAYTYNWDTAFAIPVPDVNKAIVDPKSSPPGFSYTGSGYAVSGDFGDWQITQGGDGKNLYMAFPLSNLVVTFGSDDTPIKFDSGRAVIEIKLNFIPHTGLVADAANGTPYKLVARATTQDPKDDPVASFVESTYTPAPGTVTKAVLDAGLTNWCATHMAEFAHVFSVVNLNRMVDQGKWAFVTPNYTSYAYLDNGTLEESIFAVLCMTGDRTGENLAEQVSPNAIPKGCVAGFLISQRRTLDNLIRPAVTLAYQGLSVDDFTLSPDGTQLSLNEGVSVQLKPVTHKGETYYPVLKSLTIKASGNVIQLDSYTETVVQEYYTATTTATHWYNLTLGTSNNGQALKFEASQNPSITHNITESRGHEITTIIIDIVLGIVLLILTILTDGATLILAGLVIGLMIGASQIVPPLVEKANKDDSPSIDLLLVNAVNPITWPNSQLFKLDSAGLNVSLQMGGDPRFV